MKQDPKLGDTYYVNPGYKRQIEISAWTHKDHCLDAIFTLVTIPDYYDDLFHLVCSVCQREATCYRYSILDRFFLPCSSAIFIKKTLIEIVQ